MLGLIHILAFATCVCGLLRIGPLVNTRQGPIRGLLSENGHYSMFLGIPYAEVNKANPFGPSVPHPPFSGIFKAFDDSTICPQMDKKIAVGTIDCLRLNLYVPNIATFQKRLPVMLWLHSGAFLESSGNRVEFAPDYLVRHNVIIVSINYRLGPYGFMCLDTPTVSGNQGLKDQILAFKWVNENIQFFGGDASKVTVFGESSGAKSIHLHLLSDYPKFYDKVIIQSGIAVTPLRLVKANNTVALRIAKELGFETNNVEDALIFLARQDAHSVTKASYEIGVSKEVGVVQAETRPCIENKFEGALVTDYPFNKRLQNAKNISIMIGYNGLEMLYKFGNADSKVFDTYSFKNRITAGLDIIDDEMADLVRHFYIGDEKIDISLKDQILNFESDFNYNYPIQRTIKRYMKDGVKSIYFYNFYYEGKRNFLKITYNVTRPGVSHADEMGYLFKSDLLSDEPTPEDQRIIDVMTTLWTNFAKYGDPTPETTYLLPVKWIPVTDTYLNYIKIDTELSVLKRPLRERMAFWDLFYKLNGESQNGTRIKNTEL